MNLVPPIFTIINLFVSIYLIYLFYKKYHRPESSSQLPANVLPDRTKISLVRFNPFQDSGGDQSFILCLLDNQNSGVIITSLHSRHHTRIYAKPIKKGLADNVALSTEEVRALDQTIRNYEDKN